MIVRPLLPRTSETSCADSLGACSRAFPGIPRVLVAPAEGPRMTLSSCRPRLSRAICSRWAVAARVDSVRGPVARCH